MSCAISKRLCKAGKCNHYLNFEAQILYHWLCLYRKKTLKAVLKSFQDEYSLAWLGLAWSDLFFCKQLIINKEYAKVGRFLVKSDQVLEEFFVFFEIQECQADKNWAYFLQNKGVQKLKLPKNVNCKSYSINTNILKRKSLKKKK